ncbi:MAG: ATP-binding protein [Gammaproteobacteria bacterium]|nr:ATP-binding protein [Gammaproteobacteria bacterium]
MALFKEGIPRETTFSAIPNKIKVAIGMRRTGKTHFLLQKIHSLQKKNIPLSRVFYLNFEDDRLLPITQEKLRNFINEFYSLYPENHEKMCYFFLDEIQNVESWPILIRRIFDSKQIEIYLTGSSAKLLSKEIASSLRGRSVATEIWPFSFSEYLLSQKKSVENKIVGQASKDKLMQNLLAYLDQGGFPESINLEATDRNGLLQDYVNVVIFRDIIERYGITNIALIKYMIKSLLMNVGTSFSVNKFFNDLKSQGFSVSKMTIYDYLSYIEDAYLVFTVPLYSESIRKTNSNPRKIYAIDPGLARAYTSSLSKNQGHLFENLIYLDLRRKGHEIYYYLTQERYEVDFLSKDRNGKLHLYQVVWDNSGADTIERETRALHAAEKELGIKGQIITPLDYLITLYSTTQML